MRKLISTVFATAACVLGTGAAHASDVYWSIGISAPNVGTVISNAPRRSYYPAPVYAPPPRVVYRPAPVVVVPRRHIYRPAPVVVHRGWAPVYAKPHWTHQRGWDDRRDWRDRDGRRGDRRGDRWEQRRDDRWDQRRRPHG